MGPGTHRHPALSLLRLSPRKAGERIDVDHKTAWRWRHKVMAFLAPTEQPPLSGIVEADETYFRRNY